MIRPFGAFHSIKLTMIGQYLLKDSLINLLCFYFHFIFHVLSLRPIRCELFECK